MNDSSSSGPGLSSLLHYCSVAAVGGLLFGFDSAVINGTVDALQAAFGSSTIGTGFSVASMLIGCAVGALAAGSAADRAGRRPVMIASAVAFLVSALGSGWSSAAGEFIVYRLLGGLAVGAASVTGPAYIAEVSPPAMRGRLASLQQLAIVLGIFVALLSNYAIAASAGGASEAWIAGWPAWSWMFWTESLPSVAYLVLLLGIPESPRYLVSRGRDSEAADVLSHVVGRNEAGGLVESIRTSLGEQRPPRLADLFAEGSWRLLPAVWLGVALAALQQLSGINVVFYYGAVLWKTAGFNESDALLVNVLSGVINIASTLVAMCLIDRIGRKPLLLTGSVVMSLSLGALAWVFASGDLDEAGQLTLSTPQATVALVTANLFVFGFGATWGPCVWVVLSELFPNRVRGSALALATFVLWMTNFVVTMAFPSVLDAIGLGGAYACFAAFAFLSLLFVAAAAPETRGKSLESIG